MNVPAPAGLLVVGDVVTDVLALHGQPPRPGTDTAADIVVAPGGSAANTAAWAAELGADVRLLARVGADTGGWHAARLRAAGVRPHLRTDPGRPGAVIIVLVDASGERTMLTSRGAGALLGPDDWDDALLEGVGWLHLSGYTLFTAPGRALARLALERAADRGVRVSVDPASTGFLAELGAERFLEAAGGAAVLFPNRDEAALLTGCQDAGTAAARLSGHFGLVVCKLGARGAVVAREGRLVARVPAVTARAVDSTGAGDAFAAGFLAAALAGRGAEAAAAAGCRAGALAVARVGGRPGPPGSPADPAR
ncbi:Sugar or nucleoside kinase, ribokinase family [Thermomonospora echinospora]|uniref:Sugar or nucleoside kinase, ribokinase family n=1 Tax=Thermomonospora echinospora TaxID=1992 RepID=A0A1H6D8X0_9ACTN|nr:PfkB family carbohydrate kinase [Thermomonospora echinospora]SEG81672.1 Sugar or nucleoside kinase, ribokinase family [Thermomonospora echinospora]